MRDQSVKNAAENYMQKVLSLNIISQPAWIFKACGCLFLTTQFLCIEFKSKDVSITSGIAW